MKTNWLDRTLIMGPFLTLVLTEKRFHSAMRSCRVPRKLRGNWINNNANATMHWLDNPDGKLCCILSLSVPKKQAYSAVIGLIVHEAVHVWQTFKRRIGEDNPSIEFEAYSIQSITQTLIESYDIQVKEHKNVKAKTTA